MIELFLAFSAGLISFLSPCVLPLIPGYISFVSGQSLQELLAEKKINIHPLILFCLGFSTVFIIFGASASLLGQLFLQNSEILRILAGIIIVIFSLQLIGILNIPYLNFEKRFDARESKNVFFPYIIGFALPVVFRCARLWLFVRLSPFPGCSVPPVLGHGRLL